MEKKLLLAWEELNQELLNFIKKRIGNHEDSEDILQEVYIKLHKNIDKLKDEDKLVSFIFQVTRNTINDCYRTCRKIKKVEFEEKFSDISPLEEENLNSEVIKSMKRFIGNMPDNSRVILEKFEFEDLSHREISKELDIKESTSKVRLKRAKEKLKKELHDCCKFHIDNYGNIISFEKHSN